MPEWETLTEAEWMDQITTHWMDAGSAALRSRGHFTVAMDASAECLLTCRHLATIDWPWSTTRIIPVRENCVPPGYARHCGSSIYKSLYPRKATMVHWETEHMSHQQYAERYARTLKKEGGDHPKIDLTLIALEGEQSLAALERDGEIPEFELTATYQVKGASLPALALTPWMLQASRKVLCISKGLNPPDLTRFTEQSPLFGLTEKVKHTTLLHTR